MRSSMPKILLAIWRHPARAHWSMIACSMALSVAVLTLVPRLAVDADGAAHDPTRFDPVSSLAVEEWPEPAEPLAPTNSHPYPEALADRAATASRGFAEPFTGSPTSGLQPLGRITLMPGAVLSGLMLSAEQLHVARFYAEKYRLPLEQVAEAVANAYFAAREMRVDPLLVVSVISIESAFNPKARSGQGAEGLMQVRTVVHEEKFQAFGGVAAAFDPVSNIQVGVRILRDHLLREGSVEAALKAYVGASKRRHDGGYGLRVMRERDAIQQVLAGHMEAESVSLIPSLQSPEQIF
jgi:soluble lytic murein transglycosylase-like protein